MEALRDDDPRQIDQYALLGRLGSGGMGDVFLGRSLAGRLVAVKVIHPMLARDHDFRTRFTREVEAARRVSGAFTAPVIDADPDAAMPWLVTSYVNGPSLAAAIEQHGALPPGSVLPLAAGLAEGLSAVHRAGVIHRDLKPGNVLLAREGPLLIDFGISQAADFAHITSTGVAVGTPGFMSPEQILGEPVGPSSDMFNLGAVLLFASAGEPPFGTGSSEVRNQRALHLAPRLDVLPGELRALVERCMDRDPAARPTASQFLVELVTAHPAAGIQEGWLPADMLAPAEPLPPEDPPTPPRGATTLTATARPRGGGVPSRPAASAHAPKRRRRLWAVAAAVVAVVGVAIGLIVVAPWRNPPVLQPTGLVAADRTANSVRLAWSGPASGPTPDQYEILINGHKKAVVPGSSTQYLDTGLAPQTPYQFNVVAIRGKVRSAPSQVLTAVTPDPPLSEAVLNLSNVVISEKMIFDTNAYTRKVGDTWQDIWSFSPTCPSGPCDVKLQGEIDNEPFTANLTRSGASYSGSTAINNYWHCGDPGHYVYMPTNLEVQLTEQHASLQSGAWEATSFSGTMTWHVYPASNCIAQTLKVQLQST